MRSKTVDSTWLVSMFPGQAFILAEPVNPKGRIHRFISCQFKTIAHNPANFTRLLDYVKGIGLG